MDVSGGSGRLGLFLRRPMLALTLVLVALGALTGLFAGGYVGKLFALMESPIDGVFADADFRIRAIPLTGNERTAPESVYSALQIDKGESIFTANPAALRTRLMRLPWVSDADVRRHYPGTLTVRLVEKRPFALWRNGTDVSVIERSGAVITAAGASSFARLPLLIGPGAPQAAAPLIDALGKTKGVGARLKAAERIGQRRWDLVLDGGVTVKLPEERWDVQLAELERLIVEKGVLERDIEMIDLRYPDSYVFRLHNGDSRPVLRERHA
jgi:cell division protein FtsQ